MCFRVIFCISATAALFFSTGCRDEKIATYRVPKETISDAAASTPTAAAPDMAATPVTTASGDNLAWTAPATWESRPASAMRKATYVIPGDAGATAELAITAFPGDVGGTLANVNRWRGQLSLPPIDDTALPSALTQIDFNGLHADVLELSAPDSAKRVLGAIVPVGGVTWFFKLTGPDSLILREKPAFIDFLKTVKTVSDAAPATPTATAPDMAATPVTTASTDNLAWTAPATWESRPASAMRKATYVIPGDAGTTAELAITAFPGDVGGTLANVNRWRGQLSLPPIDDTALPSALTHVDFNGLHADVLELSAPDGAKRVLGAIVPVGGVTWFFKLTGPDALVEKSRPAFLDFIKTVKTR